MPPSPTQLGLNNLEQDASGYHAILLCEDTVQAIAIADGLNSGIGKPLEVTAQVQQTTIDIRFAVNNANHAQALHVITRHTVESLHRRLSSTATEQTT